MACTAVPDFALSYAQARSDFLYAAKCVGAQLSEDIHPERGIEGEVLALDIAVLGSPTAPLRLLVSSACHGVEGYCGSGIQIAALNNEALLARAHRANVTLVFAHALNPYGFSHMRRFTHENVDLNRNFLDFTQPLPPDTGYGAVHDLLFPKDWPPDTANQQALGSLIASKGMPYMQKVVSGGQYTHPNGLFYGGKAPTWSHLAVRRMLRTHCASANALAWIDLHTGLGPAGHGERIASVNVSDAQQRASHARATRWWSGNGATPLTSALDGSSSSAVLSGTMGEVTQQECPNTETTKLTLEYGTVPPLQVLHALRSEQWNQLNPHAPELLKGANRQAMMDAFFINTPQWREQVIGQGLQTIEQAIDGLSTSTA